MCVANAGHSASYLREVELATDHGLPLGISAEADYGETSCALLVDARLTLVTDV